MKIEIDKNKVEINLGEETDLVVKNHNGNIIFSSYHRIMDDEFIRRNDYFPMGLNNVVENRKKYNTLSSSSSESEIYCKANTSVKKQYPKYRSKMVINGRNDDIDTRRRIIHSSDSSDIKNKCDGSESDCINLYRK